MKLVHWYSVPITVLLYNSTLLCSFNVGVKGLTSNLLVNLLVNVTDNFFQLQNWRDRMLTTPDQRFDECDRYTQV